VPVVGRFCVGLRVPMAALVIRIVGCLLVICRMQYRPQWQEVPKATNVNCFSYLRSRIIITEEKA